MNIQVIENAVKETNAVVPVKDAIRAALVRDLGPVAANIMRYEKAALQPIVTASDAEAAAEIVRQIDADMKAVKGHEILSQITAGLHRLHRQWTGVVNEFINPMDAVKRKIKSNVLAWESAERAKAEAEQRRLQAIADEQARKERERLEKLAEQRKTPEFKESYREQAAAVSAPVISVAAPVVGIRRARRWKVKGVNHDAFYAGLASDASLRGYVEIQNSRLERAKAANPMLAVPGVEFEQVTV